MIPNSHRANALAASLFLALFFPPLAQASGNHNEDITGNQKALAQNEFCPVLTEEVIDPNIFVDYGGKTIYFCCKRCRGDFLEKPETYLANLASVGTPKELQSTPSASGHHEQAAPQSHSAGSDSHDHATDHADSPSAVPVFVELAGRFHPLAVHFPIGLLIFAFILELISLAKPTEALRQGARLALVGGAVSAIGAVVLGWFAATGANYPGLESTLLWHRWVGVSTAVLSALALFANEIVHRGNKRFKLAYFIALLACSILVGTAGHLGATLIYGPDYLPF